MDGFSFGRRRRSGRDASASSVVSERKISSRLMRIGRSSSRPQPLRDDRARELAADVAARCSLSTS